MEKTSLEESLGGYQRLLGLEPSRQLLRLNLSFLSPCCPDTHTLVIVLFLFGFNVKKRRLHFSRAMALVNIILQELGVLAHALIDHLQMAVSVFVITEGDTEREQPLSLDVPLSFSRGS